MPTAPESTGVKLEKLHIAEVSGVDDPANSVPGWMVTKSAGSLSDTEMAGLDVSEGAEDATSIVGKIKNLLLGKEFDVTKDELTTALDERDAALIEKLAEITKSVEPAAPTSEATTEAPVPAVAAAPEAVETAAPVTLTVEDIAKAIEEAQQPLLEVIDKALDRIESLEKGTATRKSIEGQETDAEGKPVEPTVQDAIKAALSGRKVTLT